jgi:hypothetical protein
MTQSLNPLKTFFRQPAIYVRLPSDGQYWPEGSLEIPPNRELPVLPMTAMDEITYRTPDALFNGAAIVSVIQSCLPDILDAWHVPAADLDTILVAIRIASYGHEMEFGSQCPACKAKADRSLDLRLVLDRLVAPDYTQSIKSGDMEIYFRPMNYKDLTENSRLQYENQKLLQMIPDDDDDVNSEKITALSNALKRITEVTVTALAKSISMVKTPNAMVTEPQSHVNGVDMM